MGGDEQRRLEEERLAREAEELDSFERRAEWWRRHYGETGDEEAAERLRRAAEQAERMEREAEDGEKDR